MAQSKKSEEEPVKPETKNKELSDYNKSRSKNYHSSNIREYFVCPRKFTLSRLHHIEKDSVALTKGLLFEGYLFGFKEDEGYTEFDIRGLATNKDGSIAKNKGMKDEVAQPIRDRAEYFKQFFEDGTPFVKLEYDGKFKGAEKLKGEADYIGYVWLDEEILPTGIILSEEPKKIGGKKLWKRRVILDLKDTSEIYWRWGKIEKVTQVIQSVLYPFMWWKLTGELLDFVYMVCWNKSETIYKQIYVKTTKETLKLAQEILDAVDNDLFKRPNVGYDTCIKGEYNSHCDYIEWCNAGRDFVASPSRIHPELLGLRYYIQNSEIERVFDKLQQGDFDRGK